MVSLFAASAFLKLATPDSNERVREVCLTPDPTESETQNVEVQFTTTTRHSWPTSEPQKFAKIMMYRSNFSFRGATTIFKCPKGINGSILREKRLRRRRLCRSRCSKGTGRRRSRGSNEEAALWERGMENWRVANFVFGSSEDEREYLRYSVNIKVWFLVFQHKFFESRNY